MYNLQNIETQSRMTEDKRISERKRNLIILIQKYLLTLGYLDAVTKIEQQSNITLQKWDTADNVDLYMVMLEYEHYYEMKFQKLPRIVKKVDDPKNYEILKKNAIKQKQINSNIKQDNNSANSTGCILPTKPKFKKKESLNQKPQKSQKVDPSMEIQGSSISTKKKQQQELFDIRVLKGIPDYSDVPQYKELAAYLQRDILVQNPNVRFQDIIGLNDAKRLLKQAVLLPLKYPDYFTGILQPWKGVLLFGPPGTGKTMLAKSVATQCKTTFFNISASSVVSKWRGESEKLIRILFELARFYQPSTIFIDQIDSIMSQRSSSGGEHEGSRRMKTQLLLQMDGVVKKKQMVFILAASNLPWDLDIAMLRRLQKRILVDLPCLQARQMMIMQFLPMNTTKDIDYKKVAQMLQGYSGSDIHLVCKQAAMKQLRKLLLRLQQTEIQNNNYKLQNKYKNKQKSQLIPSDPITMNDILEALQTTKKSPGLSTLRYQKWKDQFGSL